MNTHIHTHVEREVLIFNDVVVNLSGVEVTIQVCSVCPCRVSESLRYSTS